MNSEKGKENDNEKQEERRQEQMAQQCSTSSALSDIEGGLLQKTMRGRKSSKFITLDSTPLTLSELYDAIICPKRIDALKRCDANVTTYNPESFLLVFRLPGRNFSMIFFPLLWLLGWGLLWEFLLFPKYLPWLKQELASLNDYVTPMVTPVSFLLVFRLGRAAVRYWDARAAMGKIVEICRCISSTATVACACNMNMNNNNNNRTSEVVNNNNDPTYESLCIDFARWICVFPIAVKNFLRPPKNEACNRFKEIGTLLSTTEIKGGVLASVGEDLQLAPIYVLNKLRMATYQLSTSLNNNNNNNCSTSNQNMMIYRQLNEQLDTLTGGWGAMERINGTPLPFVYVVHLRTLLLLYLTIWHVEAIAHNGWVAIPMVFFVSWGLLGIEAASVECERPFKWHRNHLALGKAAIVVANNVAQTIQNLDLINPPPPPNVPSSSLQNKIK